MDTEPPERRIAFPLKLRLALLRLFTTDLRARALRLIRLGDELRKRGDERVAQALYTEALSVTEETGIHHLRKKVIARREACD